MTVAHALPPCSAAPVAHIAFDVPPADRTEFMCSVEAEERAIVKERLAAFREIARAKNINEGAAYAAGRRTHLGRGWEAKTLKDLYRVFVNGGHKPGDWKKEGPRFARGDWRVLLKNYTQHLSKLPEGFLPFWINTHAQFRGRQDCIRAAWRHLVHKVWLAGKPVDGYGTVDEWCRAHGRARPNPMLVRPGELPEGWSMGNLRRYLPKRRATKNQLAHGYLEAHTHQPDQVLGDRAFLKPFERVFLDDARPDLRTLWFNKSRGEIVYPLMVLALDCASGVDLQTAFKPRALKDPESRSNARHGVTRDMTKIVICNLLRQWGLPPWPVTFVHENAAACVDAETKALFEDAFGDRIQFEATGIFKERMLEHGFGEQGGCPWDKAPIEAFFRIVQTQIANLPGTTGPRFDTAHGDLRAAEKYTLDLLDRAGNCQDVIDRLRMPGLRWDEMVTRLLDALRLLRFRTGHALQGFDRVQEWRADPSQPYQPISTLDLYAVQAPQIITRLECPAERLVKGINGVSFEPVDHDLLDYICGERRKVTVRAGKIAVKIDEAVTPLIFREPGHTLLEDQFEGETFDGVLNQDETRLVLAREGRLLGGVQRQDRIDVRDRQAIREEAGRVRSARVMTRDTLREYLVDTDVQMERLKRDNEAVLAAAPQIERAAEIKRIVREVDQHDHRKPTAAQRTKNTERAAQLAQRAREQIDAQ